MLDDDTTTTATEAPADDTPAPAAAPRTRKRAAKKAAPAAEAPPAPEADGADEAEAKPAKKTAKKATAKKTTAKKATAKKATAKKATSKKAAVAEPAPADTTAPAAEPAPAEGEAAATLAMPLFQAPEPTSPPKRTRKKKAAHAEEPAPAVEDEEPTAATEGDDAEGDDAEGDGPASRRRRRRGGRRRRKAGDAPDSGDQAGADEAADEATPDATADTEEPGEGTSRRRRRRRRAGDDANDGGSDPEKTVTRVRQTRSAEDQITAVSGSTRLEAKKQRRREGRESGRRRAPIVSEAEFLARRESVERVMVVRQREDLTQIAVLEDKVLVEHYVARESQTSLIGNVYLGRVQNVLPSMEAAFIDIGRGRNAVLYAGEVNWSALGHPDGQQRKIESVLSSGQAVLVQVTKDPIGHKGARLTSQISLAGRFLVYVPDGTTSGISRKLPDTERNRLKSLLKEIVPDTAGVIVRTAAEGASEDELTRDVERLKARWEDIEAKSKGNAPQLLYGEPDLTLKVVRDLFTEDFTRMIIQGDDAWETVQAYVEHVAPDLQNRLHRYEVPESGVDSFAAHRIDEQISKGLDRKVWLPSGGSLVIDRTEAMTVVDVNTGKFTGSGGNLEETVTKNNLEAAEEIVRQLRLRDIGGIIVVDFIDMVLESNRDLVLRRLVECLGRDRTRHQVAEVTSLGLVQMTRKRIGTGLLEAFSENCDHCAGRGVIVRELPVEPKRTDDEPRRGRRGRRGRADGPPAPVTPAKPAVPSPKDLAAVARPDAEPAPDEPGQPEDEGTVAEFPVEVTLVEETLVEETAAEETAAEEPPVEEPAAEEAPAEETPAEPAPAEPPRVVTRTRRRSATGPAGPPAALPAADVPPALAGGPTASDGLTEPGTVDAVEPGGGSQPDGFDDGVEPDEDAHPVEHVPIKKRGTRKR